MPAPAVVLIYLAWAESAVCDWQGRPCVTRAQLGYCVCVFAVLWRQAGPGPVRASVFDSEGNGKQIARQYVGQPQNYLTAFIGHGSLLRRSDMSRRVGKDIRTDGVCLTDRQTDGRLSVACVRQVAFISGLSLLLFLLLLIARTVAQGNVVCLLG